MMRIVQRFLQDYFDAKDWMHHHSIVSAFAVVSAFMVMSTSLFGLGYQGTYAADGPDMSISNNGSTKYVSNGDHVVFLYFYQNEDYPTKTANNIIVGSNIPVGMSYVSASPTPTNIGSNLEWTNLADDYGIITVEMEVDDVNALIGGSTVRISANGEDPYNNNNSATAELSSRESLSNKNSTDLSISNTMSTSTVNAGQTIEYTLSYQNISNTTAEQVIVVDTLPEGVTYVSANPAPTTISGNTLGWELDNVNANQGGTITIWGTVSTLLDDGFNILNFASIDSNNNDTNTSNNITVVSNEINNDGVNVYLSSSSTNNAIGVNKNFDINLLLGNTGPKTANNIHTSLTLPIGMSYVSASPAPTSIIGREYKRNLSSLNLGDMSTISITLRGDVAGSYDVGAIIGSDNSDLNNGDNSTALAITIGNSSTESSVGGGGGGGGGGSEGGSTSLGDIIQSATSQLTSEHSVVDNTLDDIPENTADAWARFQPNSQIVQSIGAKIDATVYPQEMVEAFVFAQNIGMTSFLDITKAMMYNELTRAQLAKFAVEYATNILGIQADMDRSTMCFAYTDTAKVGDLLQYIQYACMMKLLGQKSDGHTPSDTFRPNDLVTRAEFGTFMSRLIFGDTYNNKNVNDPQWYQAHLEALKQHGIITKIDDPFAKELRAWAMIIMYRTAEFLAHK